MVKKNRVRVYGKTFHLTPAGKILPLGQKTNPFTRCVSRTLVHDGHEMLSLESEGLEPGGFTPAMIKQNRETFGKAVKVCREELGFVRVPAKAPAKAKVPAK